jgi:hypothetical protein
MPADDHPGREQSIERDDPLTKLLPDQPWNTCWSGRVLEELNLAKFAEASQTPFALSAWSVKRSHPPSMAIAAMSALADLS